MHSIVPARRFARPIVLSTAVAVIAAALVASPAAAASTVSSSSDLSAALATAGSHQVAADIIDDGLALSVPASTTVVLDLAGFDVSVRNVALGTGAKLTITDSTDAAGTFIANASSVASLAGIRISGAELAVSGSAQLTARGGSMAAAIGGNFQGDAGVTKVSGNATVWAKAGMGAAAIGAGQDGQGGGSFTQSGTSHVIVVGSGQVSVLGAVSSTGTIQIDGGTFTIAPNSVLNLHPQHGDSASNSGTIRVLGSLIGSTFSNDGAIYTSGSGVITTTITGSHYTLTFSAGTDPAARLDSNQSTYEVYGDSFAAVEMTLPTATWANNAFDGWMLGNVAVTAQTSLSSAVGTATTGTLTAVWKSVAGVSLAIADGSTHGSIAALTATVTGATGGTVEFFAGTRSLGVRAVTNGSAKLTPTTRLDVGSYEVTAHYSGSTTAGVSAPETLDVGKATSATTFAAASSIPVGGSLLITSSVASIYATGTVTVWANGTLLGTTTLQSGTATLGVTPSLALGSYALRSDYSGDSNFLPTHSATAPLTVTEAAVPTSSPTPSSSPSSSPSSTPTPTTTGAPTDIVPTTTNTAQPTPTPTVTVTAAPSPAPTVTVTAAPTQTSSTTTITTQSGSTTNAGSSTTAAWLSATTVGYRSPVSVTAHVTATATGVVTFSSGGTVLGTAPVAAGFAILALPAMRAGTHPIVAAYSGDATNLPSVASAVLLTVTKSAATVKVTAKKFAKGTKPKLTVKVIPRVKGAAVTGRVAVYVGKKKVATVKVTKTTTRITLKKKYAKTITVRVKYLGSSSVAPAVSKAKKVAAK